MGTDSDIAEDLISSFDDHYDELQTSLNRLSHHPEDTTLINELFRSVHTIKGNAAMVQLQELVDFTHAMEETIGAMRNGNFEPTEQICDVLLIGLDRLKDLHHYYLFDKPCENVDETSFQEHFISIATSHCQTEADNNTKQFYQFIYPDIHEPAHEEEIILQEENIADHRSFLQCDDAIFDDLDLFRQLAMQVDEKNDFWKDRTDRLVYLGIKLCLLSTDITINKEQLVAAIYMHDVGMAFLPGELINKQAKLNAMEFKKLQQHVIWGHQLLQRMDGWEEAATIVLQHHEQEDGSGYPNRLTHDQICESAKIIAILDAFYAMTNLRSDRNHRRSVLRAITEINACTGTQFNEYWVTLFNTLIKNEVKSGNL